MKRKKPVFDRFWFYVVMSILAIVLLVANIIRQEYTLILVWMALVFYFVMAAIEVKKK